MWIDVSLFKFNQRIMQVQSATCSCSVELYKMWYTLADLFAKAGYFAGFLCKSLILQKDQQSCYRLGTLQFQGAAQLIQGEAQLSRVQHNSEGSSIAQKNTAQLRRLQPSSEGAAQLLGSIVGQIGCSLALKGAVQLRRCSVALRVQRSSDRVQHSSVECSIAQQGAVQLTMVQRSSGRCSGAQ